MNNQNIALIDSHYTLMLFCLLFPKKIDKTLFIVSDGVSEKVRYKLPNCIYLPDTKYTKFKKIREILRNMKYMSSQRFREIRKKSYIHFYGQDHAWFSFIGRGRAFTLLEDGLDNYLRVPSTGIKRKLLSYLGNPYLEMGRSNNISDIMLTGILPTPGDIKDKVTILDIKDEWKRINRTEKNFITNLFMSQKELNQLSSLNCKNSVLILTQPLNQDGTLDEEEKIKHYLAQVNPGESVFYKKHPRDTTNYQHLGWKELKYKDVPIELLILLGLNFRKIITYNSTAIYRFSNVERVIINEK